MKSEDARDPVKRYLEQMVEQRESMFAAVAALDEVQAWQRPAEKEWSIAENIDHQRAIYASTLPMFKMTWSLLRGWARLRRKRSYRVEIDNVYRRPGFPQNVGWLWPPRYNPGKPLPLAVIQQDLRNIHDQVCDFYLSKEPDLLGNVVLWDPAIGTLNLIQALQVGLYHDQLHNDEILAQIKRLKKG